MNPSVLNITRIGFAITGFLITVWLMSEDHKWYDAFSEAERTRRAVLFGPRWWIVVGFYAADILFSIAWVLLIILAAIAISVPPLRFDIERMLAQIITGYVSIILDMMLALIQFWWWIVRWRLRALVRISHPITDKVRKGKAEDEY